MERSGNHIAVTADAFSLKSNPYHILYYPGILRSLHIVQRHVPDLGSIFTLLYIFSKYVSFITSVDICGVTGLSSTTFSAVDKAFSSVSPKSYHCSNQTNPYFFMSFGRIIYRLRLCPLQLFQELHHQGSAHPIQL